MKNRSLRIANESEKGRKILSFLNTRPGYTQLLVRQIDCRVNSDMQGLHTSQKSMHEQQANLAYT